MQKLFSCYSDDDIHDERTSGERRWNKNNNLSSVLVKKKEGTAMFFKKDYVYLVVA